MSRLRRSKQHRVVENRWLAAGIDPACANAPNRPSATLSIAFAGDGRPSQAAQSHSQSPTQCLPPASLAIACRRAGGKSP